MTKGKNIVNNGNETSGQSSSLLEVVSIAIVAQAWLAGIFLGKITKGAYSGGFIFSMLLTIVTLLSIGMIQLHVINIGAILSKPSS